MLSEYHSSYSHFFKLIYRLVNKSGYICFLIDKYRYSVRKFFIYFVRKFSYCCVSVLLKFLVNSCFHCLICNKFGNKFINIFRYDMLCIVLKRFVLSLMYFINEVNNLAVYFMRKLYCLKHKIVGYFVRSCFNHHYLIFC